MRCALLVLMLVTWLAGGEAIGTPPPRPPPIATVAPEAYELYPGDRVFVSVFGHDDLCHYIRVPASGAVSFPLIGAIDPVAGRAVGSLRDEVKRRLEDGYIVTAMVTVSIESLAPRSIAVVGAAVRPEPVALDPLAPLTAQQALARCGGLSEDADPSRIVILREDPANPGRRLSLPVGGPSTGGATDPPLRNGDVIVVPRLDRVYVLGRVNRAGAVAIPSSERLTVSKAVSLAGGFDQFARSGKVQLLRGGSQPQVVDLAAVLAGERDAVDPTLEPGDTVFVPESRF